MRKFLFAAPLIAAVMLSGCATTTGGVDTKVLIEQIRQATVAVCGFLPTVTTVADILLAGNPAIITVGAISNAICEAVKTIPPQAARRGVAPPSVAGVVIHGRFVR